MSATILRIRVILLFIVITGGQLSAQEHSDTGTIARLMKAGKFYLDKQGSYPRDLDSAFSFFDQARALSQSLQVDSLTIAALNMMGRTYYQRGDLKKGQACFGQVVDYYRRIGDKKGEAAVWVNSGNELTLTEQSHRDVAIRAYREAQKLYLSYGDTLSAIMMLKNIADCHLNGNELTLAENELLEVLAQYKAIHYPKLYYTYDLLRAVNKAKGDPVKATFWAIEMIKSVDPSDEDIAYFYLRASEAYRDAGMHEKSLIYTRKAFELEQKTADYNAQFQYARLYCRDLLVNDSAQKALSFFSAMLKVHPALTTWQQMHVALVFSECYTQLKKYDIAEKMCLRTIALTDSVYGLKLDMINHRFVIQAYAALAELYIRTQQFSKADKYMSKVYFYPNEPNYLTDLPRFELDRSRIDSGLGRSVSALQHFQLYKRYSDSLSGIAKTVQMMELNLKYETEQKDKDLRIQSGNIKLLQQQNLLQQNQSEKFHLIRNTMIGGLLLLAILCGLIYNRYRLKQRLVRQLGQQQEEILAKNSTLEKLLRENEWLLREVHHRVKNNLQIVTALLNSQSAYLNVDKAVNAITESQSRVHAMSLIHQKLYKSQDVSTINMKEYIGDLADYLRDTYQPGRRVYFDMQVDAVNIDVVQAVPIGLILNEVISNALKHAFVHTPDPRIRISLRLIGEREIEIIIADNGPGLPQPAAAGDKSSFGMLLIHGLVEELEGTVNVRNHGGLEYTFSFRKMSAARFTPAV